MVVFVFDRPDLTAISSTDSSSSIEIGDGYQFCLHGKERCAECQVDFREDNSFTAGLDPIDREAIEIDYHLNKDGIPACKKHKMVECKNCYGFKKQINKLNKDAAKIASKKKGNESNFF
ncbi:BZ3500_MvSof-1268-A1-R1_Chr4-1g06656 [Microbotryum saponariae]|uniref:BZ3500_MvSof-1268-A1-R1_Chr4-1g06656 protein n=1 Tax=Microbotryum saponariae TaxID=289078 RepID=A0A2X0LH71_9BASI|nr:BZ3500_MvSof-1268-A1-R1_Chr4-1g06656 [Microbotryum saponariae]SDA06321.1 BZ3501_MvSof-1269-A2-R1_Chr4-1g06366 [Microbotryum saponariae]